jgi:hypothetical protein
MTSIEIPDEQAAALTVIAQAQGLTLVAWLLKMAGAPLPGAAQKPFETSRGALAEFGPAPSLEDFHQNRREMFGRFAEDK